MTETGTGESSGATSGSGGRDFGGNLLGWVIALALLFGGVLVALYVVPPEHLAIPEYAPAVRIARADDFPVGSSRVQNWGDEIILVVRTGESEYEALQGVSPADGCLLDWSRESSRVVSPCGFQVYDLHGHAVGGMTTEPLRQYRPYVRDGIVYVTRE